MSEDRPAPRRHKPHRPCTPEEDRAMTAMRLRGDSLRAIAAALGRGKSTIQLRLEALARREESHEDRKE
jgi:transposase